jgi:hypothetical protein
VVGRRLELDPQLARHDRRRDDLKVRVRDRRAGDGARILEDLHDLEAWIATERGRAAMQHLEHAHDLR